jgi:SAM-dependent methyltransferase
MTSATGPAVDWQAWLRRWDAQQSGYLPTRERRFTAMLDAVAALLPEEFVAVDLACGPGAISRRLLERFPRARCVAVDLDPVLLALGKGAIGTMNGRLRWVEADLMDGGWTAALGEEQVDAVLSTTAPHWLPTEAITRLYRDLGRLIRPGGLFLNGDNLAFGPDLPSFARVAEWRRTRAASEESFATRGAETWQQWWDAIAAEPGMTDLLAERERRFGWRDTHEGQAPIFDLHVAALRDAGFHEVGAIWQSGTNRVLMGVR